MRCRLKRLAAFALVPLSAVPIALAAPVVAPSIERRFAEPRDEQAQTHTRTQTQIHAQTQNVMRPTTPERRR